MNTERKIKKELIQQLLENMYEYQRNEHISGECMTNSMILYDHMRGLNMNCEVIVGIVDCKTKYLQNFNLSLNPYNVDPTKSEHANRSISTLHCWIEYQGKIMEPSVEFLKIKNKKYHKTIMEARQANKDSILFNDPNFLKEIITKTVEMTQQINWHKKSGKINKTNTYYWKLSEHIQNKNKTTNKHQKYFCIKKVDEL